MTAKRQNETVLDQSVDAFIERQAEMEQLRFITCGSVDDGKSTLIGRLLFESQAICEDQLARLRTESLPGRQESNSLDLSLLVDGLSSEREQGITIDVAYRYFNSQNRRFIIADTPGHEQYTRNMATAASTAQVAVLLLDASKGILTQTRRHAFIVSLMGIRHLILAINKIDLVEYDARTFDAIVSDFTAFAAELSFASVTPIPLSALRGDNVVARSAHTPWFSGPTLLGCLETIETGTGDDDGPLRFPVQWVIRQEDGFRACAGKIAAGSVSRGELVRVLPSGETATVEDLFLAEDSLDLAAANQSIAMRLDREVDVGRGDLIVTADAPCEVSDQFAVSLVWMDTERGFTGRSYWLLLGTRRVSATITDIKFRYNINTFEKLQSRHLSLNDIGEASISLAEPIPFEAYSRCRTLGAFVLIDRYSHATVGAGMINFSLRRAQNIHRQALAVDKEARIRLNGHRPRVLWFTGLSGSGKSTVANAVEQELHRRGVRTYILDGDNVRHGLNKDLGFTDADRVENIRRIAEVARLMVDAGLVVLTAFISPFRSERDMARSLFGPEEFMEIHVDVPLEIAEQRDPKGLYRKARKGELPNFTGIDSAYEPPEKPELLLHTGEMSVPQCARVVLEALDMPD